MSPDRFVGQRDQRTRRALLGIMLTCGVGALLSLSLATSGPAPLGGLLDEPLGLAAAAVWASGLVAALAYWTVGLVRMTRANLRGHLDQAAQHSRWALRPAVCMVALLAVPTVYGLIAGGA